MRNHSKSIITSAIACIVACVVEFVVIFVAGAYLPAYSQLHDTMSALGASASPIGNIISFWWMIMGIVVVVFGYAFRVVFAQRSNFAKTASWLLIIYGLGEGIGSGAFKMEHLPTGLTNAGYFHDLFGGLGVTATLILPLVVKRVISDNDFPYFERISKIVFYCGLGTIFLFLSRYLPFESSVSTFLGLWQRLYMLNTYIYFILIAIVMIRQARTLTTTNL